MSRIAEAMARQAGKDIGPTDPLHNPWQSDVVQYPVSVAAARPEPLAPVRDIKQTPAIGPQTTRPPDTSRTEYTDNLLTAPGIALGVIEQYRSLAVSLHQAQSASGLRVLMVASALPGEGKTVLASNLAMTLSGVVGRRVLLVDTDFRKPSVHTAFGIDVAPGLADQLPTRSLGASPAVQITQTLSVLPAGHHRSDSTQLLTNGVLQSLIEEWAARYDWVILDTPPIVLLADANLLSSMVDKVLLVIQAGQTPFEAVQKSIDIIGRERVLGAVLNQVDKSTLAPYLSRYDGYYNDQFHESAPSSVRR